LSNPALFAGNARQILDAIPFPVLAVDEDVRILDTNAAAAELLGRGPGAILQQRSGEALHCLHAGETAEGCGHAEACADCVVRLTVGDAARGGNPRRRRARMEVLDGDKTREIHLLVTSAPLEIDGRRCMLLILEDIGEMLELQRLLPICASCKKIRDDRSYWQAVETYLMKNLDLHFSHGLCPDCMRKLYPQHADRHPDDV